MNLKLNSKIKLTFLSIKKERNNYIVEDQLSGEFYEMPPVCIHAIKLMNKGLTRGEIENQLKQIYPKEEIDVLDFTNQLLEFGLVSEIDGKKIKRTKKNKSKQSFRLISPNLGKFFFNTKSTKIYTAIFIVNILLILFLPSLRPRYSDIFIFDSLIFSVLTYSFISLILLLIHEFGHILAGRSYDFPVKLDIGNRLFLIVLETDLTMAWKLQPKERYKLYMAGIYFEQVILFIALLFRMIYPTQENLFSGILNIIIFDIVIKTIYQCCVYMKTDLYYVLENYTGTYNLMENGKCFLTQWIPWIKKDPSTTIFKGEEKYIKTYSIFYLIGIFLTFILFFVYILPLMIHSLTNSFLNITSPNNPYFWDGVIFISITVLMFALLIYSVIKNKIRK